MDACTGSLVLSNTVLSVLSVRGQLKSASAQARNCDSWAQLDLLLSAVHSCGGMLGNALLLLLLLLW
jgi:hypothetical protein